MCRSLHPLFIDHTFHDIAARNAALVVRALELAVAHMAARLGLSARMAELVELAVRRPSVAVTRLDAFPHERGLKFLESNAFGQITMPAGLADGDVLRAAFRAMPIMRELEDRFALRDVSTTTMMTDAVIAVHRSSGGTGLPRIAVVDVRDAAVAAVASVAEEREKGHLMAHAVRRGCRIDPCRPDELTFVGGRLRLAGSVVDVIFIVDDSGSYLRDCPEDSPILRAVRAGAVAQGDGFPLSHLAHEKRIFAFLTDPEAGVPLSAEMAEVVRSHLPWTRLCRDAHTTFRGEPIWLRRFVTDHRQRLVLKPTAAFGGRGVILGWTIDPAAWSIAVNRVFDGDEDHVVQERVLPPQLRLPLIDDAGAATQVDLVHDLNPYVFFGGRAEGWWARVSQSDLLNVTSGHGSEVPVFVVESHR